MNMEKFIGEKIEDVIEMLECCEDVVGWGYIDFDGALLAIGMCYGGEVNLIITDGVVIGYK